MMARLERYAPWIFTGAVFLAAFVPPTVNLFLRPPLWVRVIDVMVAYWILVGFLFWIATKATGYKLKPRDYYAQIIFGLILGIIQVVTFR